VAAIAGESSATPFLRCSLHQLRYLLEGSPNFLVRWHGCVLDDQQGKSENLPAVGGGARSRQFAHLEIESLGRTIVAISRTGFNSDLLRVAYCNAGRYVTNTIILVFRVIREVNRAQDPDGDRPRTGDHEDFMGA
jgi:hypothetical protein